METVLWCFILVCQIERLLINTMDIAITTCFFVMIWYYCFELSRVHIIITLHGNKNVYVMNMLKDILQNMLIETVFFICSSWTKWMDEINDVSFDQTTALQSSELLIANSFELFFFFVFLCLICSYIYMYGAFLFFLWCTYHFCYLVFFLLCWVVCFYYVFSAVFSFFSLWEYGFLFIVVCYACIAVTSISDLPASKEWVCVSGGVAVVKLQFKATCLSLKKKKIEVIRQSGYIKYFKWWFCDISHWFSLSIQLPLRWRFDGSYSHLLYAVNIDVFLILAVSQCALR